MVGVFGRRDLKLVARSVVGLGWGQAFLRIHGTVEVDGGGLDGLGPAFRICSTVEVHPGSSTDLVARFFLLDALVDAGRMLAGVSMVYSGSGTDGRYVMQVDRTAVSCRVKVYTAMDPKVHRS